MEMSTNHDVPIACDLSVLDAEVRATHLATARQLISEGAAEVCELPNGYGFRYASAQYEQVTQFIANERLCCPFFSFTLEVTPAQGPLWLRISGGEGVKEFLRDELRRG